MNRAPIPPYSDIEWLLLTTPDDDEEAPWMTMPEFQWRVCALLMSILERYKHAHGLPWYLVAELKITMPRPLIPRHLDLGPDFMMAEADDHERRSWNVAEEGGPPLFVLEVVTRESWDRDTIEKPLLYERIGVREYAIFAPERKTPGPILFGYRRDDEDQWGAWEPDERGMLHSEVFGGLRFYADGGRMRVCDQEGVILPSDEDVAEAEATRADALAAELRALKARFGIADE